MRFGTVGSGDEDCGKVLGCPKPIARQGAVGDLADHFTALAVAMAADSLARGLIAIGCISPSSHS